MNIKSLLLGSAAALAVVSGAQAADAVVAAEPEPMEYVRVCDAYGTGFFYIPGTETCLKIGGYVRMRLEANDNGFTGDNDLDNPYGNWPLANREMDKALSFAAYDHTLVWGNGFHGDAHGRAELPNSRPPMPK